MGCGSSTATATTAKEGPPKAEAVVEFREDAEDDDDDFVISSEQPKSADGRNPKSAIAYAQAPTAAETQAAIERSLTIKPTSEEANKRTEVSNELEAFVPEQSPQNSPRMQKSLSHPDGGDVKSKYSLAEEDSSYKYERKHYFPDTSPTWGEAAEEEKEREKAAPVWSTNDNDNSGGAKREALFPTITVRPQVPVRSMSEDDRNKNVSHLPSIYGADGKPEPVQLAIVALEQKKMREEHEKNMGSLAYLERFRTTTTSAAAAPE